MLAAPRSEAQLQAAVVRWARAHTDHRAHLLFHVPNGGARTAQSGGVMVALGARPGIPDLFLPVPVVAQANGMARPLAGLWLELKHDDGTLSPPQRRWLRTLAEQGYAIAVAWTYDDACDAVDAYLTGAHQSAHDAALALIGAAPCLA
jgi:hypothetical protein